MVLNWTVHCLSAVCFLSFAWAVQSLFATPKGMPRNMQLISAISVVTYTGYVAAAVSRPELPAAAAWFALTALCFSLGLFGWAVRTIRLHSFNIAFTSHAPIGLVTDGPFRLLRHPCYASYILFWTALSAASRSILVVGGSLMLLILYLLAIRQEEREFLASSIATEYRSYMLLTAALLPVLRLSQKNPERE